jgi:adenylyltransferase/sulfurtransferase
MHEKETAIQLFPGKLGIIDHDRVELSNLQRQILHTQETIGMFKAESAAMALKRCAIRAFSNVCVCKLLNAPLQDQVDA